MTPEQPGTTWIGRLLAGLKRLVNLKPPYLALGGMSLTVCNMLIGNLLLVHVPAGVVRACCMTVLIATTVVVPPSSLGVLLLHYRSSAASLRSIVSLYLSLVIICANIDLDMMIHFSHQGSLPFHGMPSMWDFHDPGPMSIDWHNFFLVVVDCLHFSIETLSTVGYGDIVPLTWFAKMAVDIQVLMGLGITVLAVGTHFSARKAPAAAAPLDHAPAYTIPADAAFCPHCGQPVEMANRCALEQNHVQHGRTQSRG